MKPAPPVTNAQLKGIVMVAPEATLILDGIPFSAKTQFGGMRIRGLLTFVKAVFTIGNNVVKTGRGPSS
ncbi:MAG: hypothetical protein ACM3KE_10420 [Hyphomicrobiales bacterium]